MLDRFGGSVMITIALLSLLALMATLWWSLARRKQRASRDRSMEIPLFVVPASSPTHIARPAYGATRAGRTPTTPHDAMASPRGPLPATADPSARFGPTIRTRDGAVSTLRRPSHADAPIDGVGDELGDAVEGESLRYWRAADGTLQFLPGRLLIATGHDAGQEIRFVRTAGVDGTSVTFGRAEGAPYRHVQLREPTVSRVHARMTLEQFTAAQNAATRGTSGPGTAQTWRLENLSATNPVVVNGLPLDAEGAAAASVVLADGDRIEMGEVAFVFHSR
jgi:hypothetical protein